MRLFDGIAKSFGSFFGGGTPPPYQTPQRIQNFMQPIPTTEMQKVAAYNNLVGNKQDYDYAQLNINGWNEKLANPDLKDEDRQKINENIQGWILKRDAAAQAAENTRNSAAALGIDVSDYGTDKTLQQSSQALRNYKNVGIQNFLNLPSMGELEENRYRELRSQGASPAQADRIIGRERDNMQELLARRYTDAVATYGTNPDGTIDSGIGIPLLRGLAKVDPVTAQMFLTEFASPATVYDKNRQYDQEMDLANLSRRTALDTTRMNQQGADYRARLSSNTALTQSREGNLSREKQLAATLNAQEKRDAAQREHERQLKLMDYVSRGTGGTNANKLSPFQQSYNDLLTAYGYYAENATDEQKADAQQRAWRGAMRKHFPDEFNLGTEDFVKNLETGIAMGLPQQEALEYARTRAGWKPGEGSKATSAFNTLDEVGDFIAQGDDNSAGALLQKFDEQAEEDINKFNGMFTPEEKAKFLAMKNAYIEYLNIGADKNKYADVKALAQAQIDGKDILNAKIRAVKRNTDWKDELESIRNAKATYRRTHGEEKSTAGIDNANAKVDELLGKNKLNPDGDKKPAQSAANVPNPVGGTGYAGTYTPQPNTTNWTQYSVYPR